MTTQLQAANAKIHVVATPKVSDPQGLRRALADAQEEIATLREKLHQKLQGLVKNDPFVIAMNKEIQSLRQSLVEVMRENGDLKDKNESLFYDMKEMQDELAKCQEQIKSLPATTK